MQLSANILVVGVNPWLCEKKKALLLTAEPFLYPQSIGFVWETVFSVVLILNVAINRN